LLSFWLRDTASRMSEYFKQAYTLLPVEQRQKEWYEGENFLQQYRTLASHIWCLSITADLEEQVCSIFPALTYQQRIIGCLTCLLIGFILSMGSTFRLIKLMEGDPEPFATMYTIGNIVGLFSTCFLYGPVSQVKQMFAPTRYWTGLLPPSPNHAYPSFLFHHVLCYCTNRLVATAVYLFFMATTLLLAFYPEYIPLRVMWLLISIFFQFLALVWYNLSYIPFAREIMKNMCQTMCCKDCAAQTTVRNCYLWLLFAHFVCRQ